MYLEWIKYITGFFLVSLAAHEIAKFLQKKIHFPLITGLILTGIVAGSSFLGFIPEHALPKLNFLNEVALAIIAFSAGAELHLEGLRSRRKSIQWMTVGQLGVTFIFSTVFIFFAEEYIPFMQGMSNPVKWSIAMLFATIFVARSPSSAIAVINEMRAKGPFVKTAMGVTVVKDVLVIVLFAITFSIALTLINGERIGWLFFVLLILKILLSGVFGLLIGWILKIILRSKLRFGFKSIIIVLLGYSIYAANHLLYAQMLSLGYHFELEPLLVAIIGSFYITNYTPYNKEFEEILTRISPYVFIVFFTFTGNSLSFQVLIQVIEIALVLFGLRIFTLVLGGVFGVLASGDDRRYTLVAWMPYVTQAGVAIGLSALISHTFPEWGHEFETIVIAIIVLNQLIGPPLFKWVIRYVGEAHVKKDFLVPEKGQTLIFSLDSISLALARILKEKGQEVQIVTTQKEHNIPDIPILQVDEYSRESVSKVSVGQPDNVVLLYPDDEKNFEIAEWVYERIGSPNMIVRLQSGSYARKFKEIGVKIIEPAAAIVSLLAHLVRAPEATNLLLGVEGDQDTIDLEVRNPDLYGLHIRDLHLPQDVIILSLKRKGNTVITHGYTQLRPGDILTFVGSEKSLEKVRVLFG